jgi:hypothetical protein
MKSIAASTKPPSRRSRADQAPSFLSAAPRAEAQDTTDAGIRGKKMKGMKENPLSFPFICFH